MLTDCLPVYAYPTDNYWMDTGTPEKYLQLHRDLLSGKHEGYTFDTDVMIGKRCKIHPSVNIKARSSSGWLQDRERREADRTAGHRREVQHRRRR